MGIVIERVTGDAAKKIGVGTIVSGEFVPAPPGLYFPSHRPINLPWSTYANIVACHVVARCPADESLSFAYVLTPSTEFFHVNDFMKIVSGIDIDTAEASVVWGFSVHNFKLAVPYNVLMEHVIAKLASNLTL